MFAGNFAPRNWAFCNGQLIAISQNAALFSILGTTYGGNGTTTFALPDLRGRSPIGWGTGPGLSTVVIGEVSGVESLYVLISNLPQHAHTTMVSTAAATLTSPGASAYPAMINNANTIGRGESPTTYNGYGAAGAAGPLTSLTGGNVPLAIRNPYLGVSYIIALQGIFPSRN